MKKFSFVTVPNALTNEECDEIRTLGENLDNQIATLSAEDGADNWMSYYRQGTISWLSHEQSEKHDVDFSIIYERVDGVVHSVMDNLGIEFDITDRQHLQYTRYGKGGHYDWHRDQHDDPYEDGEHKGLIRKISIVILLSDPDEYQGGDLIGENAFGHTPVDFWKRYRTLTEGEYKKKGTAFVFPGYAHHKVTGVISGERRSLVGWYLGPPFR